MEKFLQRPGCLVFLGWVFAWVQFAMAQGWRDQCGYIEWQMLTGQPLSSLGTNVPASMVEAVAEGGHLPQGTTGTVDFSGGGDFEGKTFSPKSGPSTTSWHAATVGSYYFGNGGSGAPGTGLAPPPNPGTPSIACWEAGNYLNNILRTSLAVNTGGVAAKTQSNAWISYPGADTATYVNLVARFDYLANNNQMVVAVGLNNGSGTSVPMLMNSSYNAISCGLSNGNHSRGGTPSGSGEAGRLKPELVIPESLTSWSTGAMAGIATAIAGQANVMGGNATDARVIRAVLYSGATKHEFPTWSRTETQPIDSVVGAGEANLFHSWRILTAGAQPNASAASRGWSRPVLSPNTSQSYTFALPAFGVPNTLIATAVWNRMVSPGVPTYTYQALPLITLDVYDSSNVLIQRSASTIDNLQHIYVRNLPPGQTVRLQLSSSVNNVSNATVALAWRADPMLNAVTAVGSLASPVGQLQFAGLTNHTICRVERSADLVNWSAVYNFTTTGSTASWSDPSPPAAPVFYRLRYVTP